MVEDAGDDDCLYRGAGLLQEPLAEAVPALGVQMRLSHEDFEQFKVGRCRSALMLSSKAAMSADGTPGVSSSAVARALAACQSPRMSSEASSSVRQA